MWTDGFVVPNGNPKKNLKFPLSLHLVSTQSPNLIHLIYLAVFKSIETPPHLFTTRCISPKRHHNLIDNFYCLLPKKNRPVTNRPVEINLNMCEINILLNNK